MAALADDQLVDAGPAYVPAGGISKVRRTPKVYEPVDEPICVAIPDRRHELLADVLGPGRTNPRR